MNPKQVIPWWAKIGAKVVLSRMRIDYGRWRRWGLFLHGQMDKPEYAFGVIRSHLERLGWSDFRGKVVLELGPGDSLATAVIARALGAARVHLVDAGDFAGYDHGVYRALQAHLEAAGLQPPDLSAASTRDAMLKACHATYHPDGLGGFRTIPAGSVDLVFSQAVLEHVRLGEFDDTQREVRRVLRPDGIASHQVDLKDHLGGALNSLRMSPTTWEADWMAGSGFYTNRLRYSEVLDSMRRAGLVPETTAIERWEALPTPRGRMAARFRAMPDEELTVKQFDCLARPAPDSRP